MTKDTRFVERSFDTGEVVITYAESEGFGTPLLLLHGVTLDWHSFDEFLLPTLTGSWPIFACNLRGHGGSGWTRSGYRISDFAGDISSLLANRIGQPAILIGYSMGASVAIQVAATLPRLVAAAILIQPALAQRELAFADAADPELYAYVTGSTRRSSRIPPPSRSCAGGSNALRWPAWTLHPASRRHGPRPPHSRPSIRALSTTSCTTASASTSQTHCQRSAAQPCCSVANPS